jgi:hypothetical protein
MSIPTESVKPFPETERFLAHLYAECCSETIRGVGAIGIGNEALLVPEYTAVRAAFETSWPEADHRPFLNANIEEDTEHALLMAEIAAVLIADGADPQAYLSAAKEAVASRISYYDRLLERTLATAAAR